MSNKSHMHLAAMMAISASVGAGFSRALQSLFTPPRGSSTPKPYVRPQPVSPEVLAHNEAVDNARKARKALNAHLWHNNSKRRRWPWV